MSTRTRPALSPISILHLVRLPWRRGANSCMRGYNLPLDVFFTFARGEENALVIGNVAKGPWKSLWLRRHAGPARSGSSYPRDNYVLGFKVRRTEGTPVGPLELPPGGGGGPGICIPSHWWWPDPINQTAGWAGFPPAGAPCGHRYTTTYRLEVVKVPSIDDWWIYFYDSVECSFTHRSL